MNPRRLRLGGAGRAPLCLIVAVGVARHPPCSPPPTGYRRPGRSCGQIGTRRLGVLPVHTSRQTGGEALVGYLVGNAAAIACALLVLLVPALERLITQLAVVSYCLPIVAVGPILSLVFTGDRPMQSLAGHVGLLHHADRRAARPALGRSRLASTWSAPTAAAAGSNCAGYAAIAALPSTLAALKIAAPAALLGAIIGEYLGRVDAGLGVAMTISEQQLEVARTWGIALVAGAIAGLGYAARRPDRLVRPPVGPTDHSGRCVMSHAARLLRPLGNLVLSLAVVVAIWVGFLAAFDVDPLVAKSPLAVWRYLFAGTAAGEHRHVVLRRPRADARRRRPRLRRRPGRGVARCPAVRAGPDGRAGDDAGRRRPALGAAGGDDPAAHPGLRAGAAGDHGDRRHRRVLPGAGDDDLRPALHVPADRRPVPGLRRRKRGRWPAR